MFETLITEEYGNESTGLATGIYSWPYIKMTLNVHWFHVTYFHSEQGLQFTEVIFFTNLNQLIEFKENKFVEITAVELVSPEHMNKSGRWKMNQLKEIWCGEVPNAPDNSAHIFVLNDKTQYVYPAIEIPINNLRNKKIIFSI